MITLTQHTIRNTSRTALDGVLRRHAHLSQFTSFRIGGPAEYLATPRTLDELRGILAFAETQRLPWIILGNGTNSLFPDQGYRGVVVHLGRQFGAMRIEEDRLSVQAGAGLGAAMGYIRLKGFYDLDGLVGVPASIGGALVMNAGIPEYTISERVRHVTALTRGGTLVRLEKAECEFGYRSSLFQQRDWVVVSAELQLGAARRFNTEALLQRRRDRQPLQWPSAGCVFKNPASGPGAGALIDAAGLKAASQGGAMISPLHANFIVNRGGATASDVLFLIDLARERVYKEFRVKLQLELAVVSNANLW